jgi:ABC-2 type transport system permease protein
MKYSLRRCRVRGVSNSTWIIFAEEFRRHIRSGGYIFFTVIIPILMIAAVWIVPLVQEAMSREAPSSEVDLGRIGFIDNSGVLSGLEGQDGPFRYETLSEGLAAIERGEIASLYVVGEDYLESGKVAQYAEFKGRFPSNGTDESVFRNLLTAGLVAGQLDPALMARLTDPADFENFRVEDDGTVSELVPTAQAIGEIILPTMFALLLMFGVVAGVGNIVTSVSEEKENRLVELIITSASPFSIMAGKLLALGAIGLIQTAVWVVVAMLTIPAMFDQISDLSGLAISGSLAITIVACFITGYFMSTTIAILVGAVSSSTREASRIAPLITMVGFVPLWFMGFLINYPDSLFTRLLSYIPFTAPSGILVRIGAGGEISYGEIAAALAGVVTTGLLFLWISARVFRAATLMQGQSFTPRNLWSALRHAD